MPRLDRNAMSAMLKAWRGCGSEIKIAYQKKTCRSIGRLRKISTYMVPINSAMRLPDTRMMPITVPITVASVSEIAPRKSEFSRPTQMTFI